MDDKVIVPLLQKLVTPSYRRLKDWIIKKPADEQLSFLSKQLARDEKRIAELSSSENQRLQVSQIRITIYLFSFFVYREVTGNMLKIR